MTLDFRLYLITDRRLVDDLPVAVERALSGVPRGSAAIQLREKDLPAAELLPLAQALAAICHRRGAPLLVNDRIDVALAAGADGVHLSGGSLDVSDVRTLLGSRLIGASCHSADQLRQRAGADFATYSPIFPSPRKPPAVGLQALREAVQGPLPLLALGGVDPSNARDVIAAGARGVAVIRAWLLGDPAEATAQLLHSL